MWEIVEWNMAIEKTTDGVFFQDCDLWWDQEHGLVEFGQGKKNQK